MQNGRLGIDHPLVTVRDLDGACQRYQQFGFQTTPRGYHPWGTANHFVLFGRGFIELLGVYDESRLGQGGIAEGRVFSRFIGDFLARRDCGLSLVALHSDDAAFDHNAIENRGLKSTGLVDFRRAVTLPDGTPDEAVVTLSVFIHEAAPNTSVFVCQQHKPHLVWVPAWQHHPNGADGIVSVTYIADAPLALTTYYQALFGSAQVQVGHNDLRIHTPNGVLEIIAVADLGKRYPDFNGPLPAATEWPCGIGIRVHCPEIAQVQSHLHTHSLPYELIAPNLIRLTPDVAYGIILELVS